MDRTQEFLQNKIVSMTKEVENLKLNESDDKENVKYKIMLLTKEIKKLDLYIKKHRKTLGLKDIKASVKDLKNKNDFTTYEVRSNGINYFDVLDYKTDNIIHIKKINDLCDTEECNVEKYTGENLYMKYINIFPGENWVETDEDSDNSEECGDSDDEFDDSDDEFEDVYGNTLLIEVRPLMYIYLGGNIFSKLMNQL